ncbi:regulatory protein RecX [Cohnella sp. 56]|uniref:regulatory protein RecX n=1 Tax=Cohnella sp. 56 TaxID=3113722 RepID=UPI0030E89833
MNNKEANSDERIVDISEEADWERLQADQKAADTSPRPTIGGSRGSAKPRASFGGNGGGAKSRASAGGTKRKQAAPANPVEPDDGPDDGVPAAAVITAVEADPKRPSMYKLAVAVEGASEGASEEAMLSIHEDTLVAWRLLKGRRLSPEEWAMLRKEQEKEEAYRSALYMLEFKTRTQTELRRGLARKGYSTDAIAGCLERVVRQGYVNDAVFAQRFAEQRVTGHKKGSRLIRQELMQRGVDKLQIDEAIRGLDEDAERASALALAKKRWPSVKGKSERERQMKLMNMLLRRGFPGSTAREAVRLASESVTDEGDWDGMDDSPDGEDFQ